MGKSMDDWDIVRLVRTPSPGPRLFAPSPEGDPKLGAALILLGAYALSFKHIS